MTSSFLSRNQYFILPVALVERVLALFVGLFCAEVLGGTADDRPSAEFRLISEFEKAQNLLLGKSTEFVTQAMKARYPEYVSTRGDICSGTARVAIGKGDVEEVYWSVVAYLAKGKCERISISLVWKCSRAVNSGTSLSKLVPNSLLVAAVDASKRIQKMRHSYRAIDELSIEAASDPSRIDPGTYSIIVNLVLTRPDEQGVAAASCSFITGYNPKGFLPENQFIDSGEEDRDLVGDSPLPTLRFYKPPTDAGWK